MVGAPDDGWLALRALFLFYTNISRTSAVSSTNFGSILIFASCVVGTCNILCFVPVIINIFFLPGICFHIHLLSSFWTRRSHRCRPFSPRSLPSIFIAHRVQQSHCSSTFHRVLLTHALAFIECCYLTLCSSFPHVNLCARKSPHKFIRVCTRGHSNSRN